MVFGATGTRFLILRMGDVSFSEDTKKPFMKQANLLKQFRRSWESAAHLWVWRNF